MRAYSYGVHTYLLKIFKGGIKISPNLAQLIKRHVCLKNGCSIVYTALATLLDIVLISKI
jgi:hypothetical protein